MKGPHPGRAARALAGIDRSQDIRVGRLCAIDHSAWLIWQHTAPHTAQAAARRRVWTRHNKRTAAAIGAGPPSACSDDRRRLRIAAAAAYSARAGHEHERRAAARAALDPLRPSGSRSDAGVSTAPGPTPGRRPRRCRSVSHLQDRDRTRQPRDALLEPGGAGARQRAAQRAG